MAIKKAYVELYALLEANKGKKVSAILKQVEELCQAKNSGGSEIGTTYLKNDKEETIAIFCYYFKKWMPVAKVDFGKKKGTASGYNTMCKEGVSNWTKQQRQAKKDNEALLVALSEGTMDVKDLEDARAQVELTRKYINKMEDTKHHYSTAEDVIKAIG